MEHLTLWFVRSSISLTMSNTSQCPYFNGTTYTAADNTIWQVYCGFDMTAGIASTPAGSAGSVAQCMSQCNGISDCTMFTYTYGGAEPVDAGPNTEGNCESHKVSADT